MLEANRLEKDEQTYLRDELLMNSVIEVEPEPEKPLDTKAPVGQLRADEWTADEIDLLNTAKIRISINRKKQPRWKPRSRFGHLLPGDIETIAETQHLFQLALTLAMPTGKVRAIAAGIKRRNK